MAKKQELKGLFYKYLGKNHDSLYQDRIQALSEDIKAASEDYVRELEKKERNLKRDLESMLDLGIKSRQDLVPNFEDIDPEEWAARYHELSLALTLNKAELDCARKTHNKLFKESVEETE